MVHDSITNASIPTAGTNSKDFAKKKRVNRTAKLKQSKLDVRREQWLSQVKNKGLGLKEGTTVTKMAVLDTHAAVKERDHEMVKLEISVGGDEEKEGLMNLYSDSESNSPTSHTSSLCGSNMSGTNFTGSSGMSSSGSSSSSSSSGSGGCVSGNMTDEDDDHINEDEDDDCLDDWEAMADALEADEIKKDDDDDDDDGDANLESPVHETGHESEPVLTTKTDQTRASFIAWRPDDVSRPQCLPNLLKQHSFPMKSGMCHVTGFVPTSCPICCEDLDMTDSSFMPCPCGYRLCLFCHKRILEDNGRCPGCRKQYEQPDQKSAPLKVARCYSMNQMR